MRKSEVYSWRVSPELKSALEQEARKEGSSLADLLEKLAREWLEIRRRALANEEHGQERLHAAARTTLGAIRGGRPRRSEQARDLIRQRVRKRREG
jgi:hypothetical protein